MVLECPKFQYIAFVVELELPIVLTNIPFWLPLYTERKREREWKSYGLAED